MATCKNLLVGFFFDCLKERLTNERQTYLSIIQANHNMKVLDLFISNKTKQKENFPFF